MSDLRRPLTRNRAPWLWQNVTPAIPIVFVYISFLCISSLIHASVTDPGVSSWYLASLSIEVTNALA